MRILDLQPHCRVDCHDLWRSGLKTLMNFDESFVFGIHHSSFALSGLSAATFNA
jgi:hypothetical protein